MKIFITGATGYIGGILAFRLANEGHILHALVRSPQKAQKLVHKNISLIQGDLSDKEKLQFAMKGCDAAFHLAACTSVYPEPGTYVKVNIDGTRNILEAATIAGVKKILFTSTAGVAGPSDNANNPVNEKTIRTSPYFNEYESSKAEAEKLVLSYMDKIDVIILSPTRVYGPGEESESNAVTRLIKLYISGKWRIIPGDGSKVGNYVYVEDVVQGHTLALTNAPNGSKYLLGGENATYEQLFKNIGEATGNRRRLFKIPVLFMVMASGLMVAWGWISGGKPLITPKWVKKYLWHWAVSSDKAKKELNYKVTPLKTGLKLTVDSLADQKYDHSYAVITGASSGIGKALAERLAIQNRNLILTALSESGLSDYAIYLKEKYKVKVHTIDTDLTRPGSPEKLYEWCVKNNYAVSILINNAGVGNDSSFADSTVTEIRNMMRLNMDATVTLTKLFIPELKKHPISYILNSGSLAAIFPVPFKCVYSGSKSFVYVFSKTLRSELKSENIFVSCLCPGPVNTNPEMIKKHDKMGWKIKLLAISPEEVAEKAIKELFKKRAVIIPGYMNKIALLTTWLIPPFLVTLILDTFQKNQESKKKTRLERELRFTNNEW